MYKILIVLLYIANWAISQCIDSEYSTSGVLVDINEEIYNNDESVNAYSIYSWTSNDLDRILSGNGIPNHEVGTFPNANNPNTISEQNVAIDFPLNPEIASDTGIPTRVVAYALNGVKFEVGTAGTCTDSGVCSPSGNGGEWLMEAVGEGSFDFGEDDNHGHVQPFGAYHYHGMPELLIDFLGGNDGMTLIGWASDGFPVYARYGYSNPEDSQSQLKVLTTSYRLKSQADENRPNTLTAILGGPNETNNISKPIPMGAFTQDYEYVEGLGDLDECNGRFGTTPEFPNGIYYYVVSDDFPFFTRCLKGGV